MITSARQQIGTCGKGHAMAKRKLETRIQKMLRSDGALCLTFINTGLGKRKALEP